jgi:hypothetical protein
MPMAIGGVAEPIESISYQNPSINTSLDENINIPINKI